MSLAPEHHSRGWLLGTSIAAAVVIGGAIIRVIVALNDGPNMAATNALLATAVVASMGLITAVGVSSLKTYTEHSSTRTAAWLKERTDKQARSHDKAVTAAKDEILQAIKELRVTELTLWAEQEQSNIRTLRK